MHRISGQDLFHPVYFVPAPCAREAKLPGAQELVGHGVRLGPQALGGDRPVTL